ncbi:MAG: NYN domain-containing protein, partial [Candidatus Sungbacteria bacterium]|nr:NYN domain-containing protein [Candidatus Sungbacteria bacterium]
MGEDLQKNTAGAQDFVSLALAAKERGVSQDYLRFLIFKKKLNAVKLGRNWVTRREWVDAYFSVNGRGKTHPSSAETQQRFPSKQTMPERVFASGAKLAPGHANNGRGNLPGKPKTFSAVGYQTLLHVRNAVPLLAIAGGAFVTGAFGANAVRQIDPATLARALDTHVPKTIRSVLQDIDRIDTHLARVGIDALSATLGDVARGTQVVLASLGGNAPGSPGSYQVAGPSKFFRNPLRSITDSLGQALCNSVWGSCTPAPALRYAQIQQPVAGMQPNTPPPPPPLSSFPPPVTAPSPSPIPTAPRMEIVRNQVTELTRVREVVERTQTLIPADLTSLRTDLTGLFRTDLDSLNRALRAQFDSSLQELKQTLINASFRPDNTIQMVTQSQKIDQLNGITVVNGMTVSSGYIKYPDGTTQSSASRVEENLAVNGGSITTSATTGNLFDSTVLTLNIGGAATNITIGALTGTTTIRNATTSLAGVLTVTGTGNSSFAGNLGIATTSPGTLLALQGVANFASPTSTLYSAFTLPSFSATSTTATSTLAGFLDVTGAGSNATSTYASNLWVKGGLQIGASSLHLGANYLNFTQSASTSLASAINAWNINNLLSLDTANARIGIATSTPQFTLANQGNLYTAGTGFFGSTLTATSTVLLATTAGNVGIGTTSPSARLDMVQGANGQIVVRGRRITDTAPSGDFLRFTSADGATNLYRVDNSGNVFQGGVINSGSISITSTSTPQLRVQYDASNEVTTSVTSAGATTYGFNGTTPTAAWVPQSNSVNTYSFNDASSMSILSVDTTNRRVGVGTTSPGSLFSVQGVALISSNLTVGGTLTATSSVLLATTAGNVGIGTTSPAQLLSVAGHCVTGDTRLRRRRRKRGLTRTGRGQTQNGDEEYIYDEVQIKDIQQGDEIASLNEKTGQIVWSKVNALMDMGVQPIYKLTTASGKTIRTTAEHPYLVKNIGNRATRHASPIAGAGWLEASNINTGDIIATANTGGEKNTRAVAFIDYANIKAWVRGKGLSVDLKMLRSMLGDAGISDVRFYYGSDSENTKIFSFFRKLESFGYTVITKSVQYFRITLSELLAQAVNIRWLGAVDGVLRENLQREASRLDREHIELLAPKANFDVEIAVDALRCAKDTDTLVLFSGDGDFAYLAKELKTLGKRVIVVSGRKSLSGALMKEADKFVTLERLGDQAPGLFVGTQNPPQGRVLKNCTSSIAGLLGLSSAPVDSAEMPDMVWARVASLEKVGEEQVYDIEVEGTHN